MSKQDYYDILGVSKTANEAEIKKAYRKLAMKYHPDRNPGDAAAEKSFKSATEAYEVLSDKQKRSRYDQFGHAGMHQGADYHNYSDMNDIFSHFGDIFGNIFGQDGRGQQRRSTGPAPQQGHDLAYDITISLKEAFVGCKKEIKVYHYVTCNRCKATGCKPGTSASACSTCRGSGQNTVQQGFFAFSQPCQACSGNGFSIQSPCGDCRGQSRVQQYDKLSITIPAGIFQNADLRVAHKGDAGVFGGPAGHLYVKIAIQKDDSFHRRDDDLVCTLSLTYPQLVLGSQLEIESIDGTKHTIKVPKGCSVGHEIVIPGKGFSRLRGYGAGNLVFVTDCRVPKKTSREAKEALLAYDKIAQHDDKSGGGISGFFKKFLG